MSKPYALIGLVFGVGILAAIAARASEPRKAPQPKPEANADPDAAYEVTHEFNTWLQSQDPRWTLETGADRVSVIYYFNILPVFRLLYPITERGEFRIIPLESDGTPSGKKLGAWVSGWDPQRLRRELERYAGY